jgi:hypothetical protein
MNIWENYIQYMKGLVKSGIHKYIWLIPVPYENTELPQRRYSQILWSIFVRK